ncbi:terminase family protein [Acidobacteria bacterium AH-259-D05]|nr:terminase family protein [Acidobacteria bacterium AH-259-D05]
MSGSELSKTLTRDAVQGAIRLKERNMLDSYYPDEGPLRRELYPKQLAYFKAGKKHRERIFLAANRVGKTLGVGAFEVTLHLTGKYPDWWEGRRFNHPVKAWAAGDTSKTVRDIIQEKMLGPAGNHGTGMIPGDLLVYTRPKAGIPDAVEIAYVKHITGDNSVLVFKSYDQRREAFQGTEQDVIWMDEEPSLSIYSECLTRTMTTNGLLILTFTPLQGITDLVKSFLPGGRVTSGDPVAHKRKLMIPCTWDEVPHLDDEAKEELYESYPPYQRKARTRGIPSLGSGAIYPIDEEDIVVKPFEIPEHWPRAYGMDVGWNVTAAGWFAQDPDTTVNYMYGEYYRRHAEPVVHAHAIQGRGKWIPGVVDPAARGRGQKDGVRMLQVYQDLGLDIQTAENAVEAGIYIIWQLLSAENLKVFNSCNHWREEFRLYRRDEDGKIVKENDHLMDLTRYWALSGRDRMTTEPQPKPKYRRPERRGTWMSR